MPKMTTGNIRFDTMMSKEGMGHTRNYLQTNLQNITKIQTHQLPK